MSNITFDLIIARATINFLKGYLDNRNIGWKQLANKADVAPSALSQLKTGKRNLTTDMASKLSEAMEMREGDFYMRLMKSTLRLQHEENKALQDVIYAGKDYIDGIIQSLMDTLRQDDVYWLIAIEPPIEFREPSLDNTLLSSISNGAYIHYVFPSVRSDDLLSGRFQGTVGVTELFPSQRGINLDTEFFLWQKGFVERHKSHKDLILSNIHCYTAPLDRSFLFFAPFIKYILIERSSLEAESQSEAWLDVAYFNGRTEGLLHQSEQRCVLPLNPTAVYHLSNWCQKTTTRAEKPISG